MVSVVILYHTRTALSYLVDSLSAVCRQGPLNTDAVRVCATERLLEPRERESGGGGDQA